MKLILPTGPDGAARAYELDNVLDIGHLSLNDVIEMRRATGMDLPAVYKGLTLLDRLRDLPNDEVLLAMSKHLELMESYRALVWIARHHAGDRAPGGAALTVEQAAGFPFTGLAIEPDPGDKKPGDDDADPPLPSADGGPGTVDGAVPHPANAGHSSPTSGATS